MNKFWWSIIMIAAIVIIAIIDIKTMPIWVVIVNVALGIVAAFEIVILLNYSVMVTHTRFWFLDFWFEPRWFN